MDDKGNPRMYEISPEDYIYQHRAECEILMTYFDDSDIN